MRALVTIGLALLATLFGAFVIEEQTPPWVWMPVIPLVACLSTALTGIHQLQSAATSVAERPLRDVEGV